MAFLPDTRSLQALRKKPRACRFTSRKFAASALTSFGSSATPRASTNLRSSKKKSAFHTRSTPTSGLACPYRHLRKACSAYSWGGQLKRLQKSALNCCGCWAMRRRVATAGVASINFLSSGLFEIANAIDWNTFGRASHRDHLPGGGFDFRRPGGARRRRVAVRGGIGHPSARPCSAGHPRACLRRLGRTGCCQRRRCVAGPRDIGIRRLRIGAAINRVATTGITTASRGEAQRTSEYAPEADSDRERGPKTPDVPTAAGHRVAAKGQNQAQGEANLLHNLAFR